jgi:hypothetical protein
MSSGQLYTPPTVITGNLLRLPSGTTIDATLRNIEDGLGVATGIQVSTGSVALTKVLLSGIGASVVTYPLAKAIFSDVVSADVENHNIGVVGAGLATFSVDVTPLTGWGVGGYFKGWANGTTRSAGVVGEGMVNATGDTGGSIGVRGYSKQTHAGGSNIGLYADASGGATNYALYMNSGGIFSNLSTFQTWTFSPPINTDTLRVIGYNSLSAFTIGSAYHGYHSFGGFSNCTLYINASSGTSQLALIGGSGDAWTIGTEYYANRGLAIFNTSQGQTFATSTMYFGGNNGVYKGKVGIGTITPRQTLDVIGKGLFTGGLNLNGNYPTYGTIVPNGMDTEIFSAVDGYVRLKSKATVEFSSAANAQQGYLFVSTTNLQSGTANSCKNVVINYVVNQAVGATGKYTAIELNVTETSALGVGNLLIDLQVGTVSKFSVSPTGSIVSSNGATFNAGVQVDLTSPSSFGLRVSNAGVSSAIKPVSIETGGVYKCKSYTVATLPASGSQAGDCAYVTDANSPSYLAVVGGGGAIGCYVQWTGASWVCC